jgi:peptide/nickel transport system ATP-binding protein
MIIPRENIILSISGLTIRTTGKSPVTLVDELDFDIEKSKITALIGESGSGKTLTALSIPGLGRYIENTEISGKILFRDGNTEIDLMKLPEKSLSAFRGKKIALILQDPMSSFNPNKKCGHQLTEVIRVHTGISNKEASKLAIAAMAEMKLSQRHYNAYPHQLSGGELQRLSIAAAVSVNPKLIIADEPTTNLDPLLTAEILDMIRRINREKGISFLIISHDLRAIRAVADNIGLMKYGKIQEYKRNEDFFGNPENIHSIKLVDAYFNFSLSPSDTKPSGEILRVSKLSKSFDLPGRIPFIKTPGQVKVIHDVSFILKKGESIGIIGESGSGKSTLARILVRLESEDGGYIVMEGTKLTHKHAIDFIRNNIQMVFQNPASTLNKAIRIKTLLDEPFENIRENKILKQNYKHTKKMLGIEETLLKRYPSQISGGEAQRIALARALAFNPGVIVMDESLSALDRISQNEILKLLNELKLKKNISFVFITHDLQLARHFCDRSIILRDGIVVEEGITSDIFSSPGHEYTKSLIDAVS